MMKNGGIHVNQESAIEKHLELKAAVSNDQDIQIGASIQHLVPCATVATLSPLSIGLMSFGRQTRKNEVKFEQSPDGGSNSKVTSTYYARGRFQAQCRKYSGSLSPSEP